MDEDLVAEPRTLLEELLIPELRANVRKMNEFHEQMVLSKNRGTLERTRSGRNWQDQS